MSNPTGATPAAAAPAAPTVPATTPPAGATTPKKSWYKVTSGHDWGQFEAQTPADAESKFRQHFGITGSQHRFETSQCDVPAKDAVWHSGQQRTR